MASQEVEDKTNFLQAWKPQSLQSEATTFPAEMYSSPRIYQLELERIFGKSWYYVGHVSQLQDPCSYFTVDIAEQPLVILQNKAGELRGFFNVCTHRAGPIAMGSGKCSRLTCLYHAWSFDFLCYALSDRSFKVGHQFPAASEDHVVLKLRMEFNSIVLLSWIRSWYSTQLRKLINTGFIIFLITTLHFYSDCIFAKIIKYTKRLAAIVGIIPS